MGLGKWLKNEALPVAKKAYSYTPAGMVGTALTGDSMYGLGGNTAKQEEAKMLAGQQGAVAQGMAQGKALGQSIMSDPDLVKSRDAYKENLALTGPDKDLINQQASRQVENMKYQGGGRLTPQQKLEAQRKLSSDIGAQKFSEDRNKAESMYDLDLGKAKFLGTMSMAGAQMANAQQRQESSNGLFSFLGF